MNDEKIIQLLERIALSLESLVAKEAKAKPRIEGVQPRVIPNYGTPEWKDYRAEYERCLQWAKLNQVPDVRMGKAIAIAGVSSFSEITLANFAGIKNCGEKTIRRLIEWAEMKKASQ